MNKKGITLIEFIVSIALVGIVMIFLFNLLLDVQYTAKNGNYAKENQLNRASILREVMYDFTHLGLVGMTDTSTYINLTLNFKFQDGSEKTLTVNKDYVLYGTESDYEKWSLKRNDDATVYQTSCVEYHFENAPCCTDCAEETCSDYFYFHVRIPVLISKANDNAIDDLELFYIGKSSDINRGSFPSKSFLGYESNTCVQ